MGKVLMYGAVGLGKTSTKDLIVGSEPAKTRVSTPLATRPTTERTKCCRGSGLACETRHVSSSGESQAYQTSSDRAICGISVVKCELKFIRNPFPFV